MDPPSHKGTGGNPGGGGLYGTARRGEHTKGVKTTEAPFLTGTICSLAGHLFLALFVLLLGPKYGDFGQPVVYSVSIEGGKKLGGIQQLQQADKPQMAPPKNVSEPAVKGSEKEKEEPKKEEPKSEVKPEDAEVSVREKPSPVPKATAAPKAAPEPKKGEEDGKARKKTGALSKSEDKQLQSALQRYLGESSNAGGEGFGAAALGPGNGMGGGIVRPPEFFIYFNVLKNHVYRNWRWPGNAPRVASITFHLEPDGTISDVRVERSSGDSYYDDLAYRAILKANPVPPPPKSVYEFFKETRFHFDSKGNAAAG